MRRSLKNLLLISVILLSSGWTNGRLTLDNYWENDKNRVLWLVYCRKIGLCEWPTSDKKADMLGKPKYIKDDLLIWNCVWNPNKNIRCTKPVAKPLNEWYITPEEPIK